MGAVKVYVCDDHELFRDGLALVLTGRGIDTDTGPPIAAINRVPALKPDVVIVRDQAEHLTVVTSIHKRCPAAFLMINGRGDVSTMDAISAGVTGVADAGITVDRLVLALETVAGGAMWIDDQCAVGMRDRVTNGIPTQPLDTLNPMERKVADLLMAGMTNRQIAAELYIAEKTAKNYTSKVMQRLDVPNRTAAAIRIREMTG